MMMDAKPYNIFKELRRKYPEKMVLITDANMSLTGFHVAFPTLRDYVKHRFLAEHHLEIYRWTHNYKSLDGANPEMGLVYLANDSVLQPGIEVWALVNHNARYTDDKPKAT